MLREDRQAGFVREGRVWRRHRFVAGRRESGPLTGRRLGALDAEQGFRPVCLLAADGRRWWWFRDRFYSAADDLAAPDVAALALDRERRRSRTLERAHAALRLEAAPRRMPLPRDLRRAVWERDGGRCVSCDERFDLQFDHVIPVALGGATSVANLQLLCGPCNRLKGDRI